MNRVFSSIQTLPDPKPDNTEPDEGRPEGSGAALTAVLGRMLPHLEMFRLKPAKAGMADIMSYTWPDYTLSMLERLDRLIQTYQFKDAVEQTAEILRQRGAQ